MRLNQGWGGRGRFVKVIYNRRKCVVNLVKAETVGKTGRLLTMWDNGAQCAEIGRGKREWYSLIESRRRD